jgi:hypothetical protein
VCFNIELGGSVLRELDGYDRALPSAIASPVNLLRAGVLRAVKRPFATHFFRSAPALPRPKRVREE